MRILAIDPGTSKSGVVLWEDGKVRSSTEMANDSVLEEIACFRGEVAIEMIASYGMSVGKETFETCLWIGRMIQCADEPEVTRLVYRREIKIYLCGTMKAKDGNIRQALIDKLGPVGTKKTPGPLYGISGHLWSALAIADYVENNPAL